MQSIVATSCNGMRLHNFKAAPTATTSAGSNSVTYHHEKTNLNINNTNNNNLARNLLKSLLKDYQQKSSITLKSSNSSLTAYEYDQLSQVSTRSNSSNMAQVCFKFSL